MQSYFKFIFLFPLFVYAQPAWYMKHDLVNENIKVGYGQANSKKEAKQIAINEIASSLSISVQSSISTTKYKDKDSYRKKIINNSQQNINATLNGIKTKKEEFLNGIWYIKVVYDNTPLDIKIKGQLPSKLSEEKQNNYLKNTSLVKYLNKEIGTKLNYKIIRQNNIWQIKYNNIVLPLSSQNFYDIFTTQSSDKVTLKANKRIYKINDEIYFNISIKSEGYVSLINIESDGKVGIVLDNYYQKIKFRYPKDDGEYFFTISNNYGKYIEELYIAIYHKHKIDFTEFENVTNTDLGDGNFKFHKVIDLLDQYDFSSFKIKIQNI